MEQENYEQDYIKRLEVTKIVESIVILEDEKQISLQEQISS